MSRITRVVYPLVALVVLTPWVSSGMSLLLGLLLAIALGNPYQEFVKLHTHRLLSYSIIGLGAGMNLAVVAKAGADGFLYTVLGISFAIGMGLLLGRVLRTQSNVSLLISVGTAICGGSAIAAVAPVIRAKDHEISVALGIVFVLNAIALLLFPWIGHQLNLSEAQFGLWSALAIHDTSSVVGATLEYGSEALEVGTTVKLGRALWIIPLTLLIAALQTKNQGDDSPMPKKKPWFILGFLIMAALVTFFPLLEVPGEYVAICARRLMVLTLFFIGASLTRDKIAEVGIRPFVQGIVLWILVAGASLAII